MSENEPYYADTAFDSTRPRTLGPRTSNISSYPLGDRQRRKHRLPLSHTPQCGEYIRTGWARFLKGYQTNSKAFQPALKDPVHEEWRWGTLDNPWGLVSGLTRLAALFTVPITGGLLVLLLAGDTLSGVLSAAKWFLAPVVALYLLGKLTLKLNLFPDKNDIHFSRRTGLVTVPRIKRLGDPFTMRFDEVEPYLFTTMSATGGADYRLYIGHRSQPLGTIRPAPEVRAELIYLEWEFLCRFMDISQPLPDIPEFEPVRHKDPVTADYDRRHNRPAEYWKNIPVERYNEWHGAAYDAIMTFPWGATRAQALANGWRPSGHGEADWAEAR